MSLTVAAHLFFEAVEAEIIVLHPIFIRFFVFQFLDFICISASFHFYFILCPSKFLSSFAPSCIGNETSLLNYDLDNWASFSVSGRGVIPSLSCQASYRVDPGGCLPGLNPPVLQSTGSRVRPKTASQADRHNDRRIFITAPQG
jgi:hypothetical protein